MFVSDVIFSFSQVVDTNLAFGMGEPTIQSPGIGVRNEIVQDIFTGLDPFSSCRSSISSLVDGLESGRLSSRNFAPSIAESLEMKSTTSMRMEETGTGREDDRVQSSTGTHASEESNRGAEETAESVEEEKGKTADEIEEESKATSGEENKAEDGDNGE